jgi:uncharacterized membrane protein YqgA involved in biofilm formation
MIGLGTVVNIFAILLGSTIGVFAGAKFPERTRNLVTDVLGFVVALAAADALRSLWNEAFKSQVPRGWTLLTVLAALLLGAISGSVLKVEAKLEILGERLKRRFNRSGRGKFVEGFVSSSLLFVIGPLAILGGISDGMGNGHDQLILKSTLDFFASIAFASTLGWGVAASALPVGVYQFIWTGLGFALGNVLSDYQVQAMTAVGGVLLLGISFRLLEIKMIHVGDLVPALFFAPVVALIAHQF